MSQVLVVQPEPAQEDTLRHIFRRIGAELVLARSTREAVDAVALHIPDLILLSTFMSPRDEDALMSHLRTLENAAHLQTLTLPQFRTGTEEAPAKKGGFFSRKKVKPAVSAGIDPNVFAEEVVAHLHRATEIRNRPAVPKYVPAYEPEPAPEPVSSYTPEEADAWTYRPPPPEAESMGYVPVADVEHSSSGSAPAEERYASFSADATEQEAVPEPYVPAEPYVPVSDSPVVEPYVSASPDVSQSVFLDDDIDQLARELGLDVRLSDIKHVPATPPPVAANPDDPFDFGVTLDRARNAAGSRRSEVVRGEADAEAIREAAIAEARAAAEREAREALAELARVQAEAEEKREAAIAEARAAAEREAREALAADLARVQAEAEAMREVAIAEARAAAEREARDTLDAELARVRTETELTVADALNKVKLEAEEAERARLEAERLRVEAQEAFAAELARVRAEVEQTLTSQLEASRAEAERMRAAEANAVRERAAVEAQLKTELERLRIVTAQARKADESETKKANEQIKQLEVELAKVRQKAEERQAEEVQELRAQMADMREAAAKQARAAAAEAVASEVARATAHAGDGAPRKLNVVRMPARLSQLQPVTAPPKETVAPPPPRLQLQEKTAADARGDYYSLWQPESSDRPASEEVADNDEAPRVNFKRHAKWALPVAACLLLVTRAGTSISTVTKFVAPAAKPAATVEPVEKVPTFSEVVATKVGSMQVESIPPGAEAVVDGKSYGPTPVTIPDLAVGSHTLVLKSTAGTVSKKVAIKANETALVSEAIFSGWLAIFSPIPMNVVVDGQPVSLSEEGRVMVPPGKHVVALISDRFNYRSSETVQVRPGETTAHTVILPTGSVRVTAPEGVEIRIDGQAADGTPGEGLSVAIGSHEISGVHPQLGERRVTVDVRHGALTEVTLPFAQ